MSNKAERELRKIPNAAAWRVAQWPEWMMRPEYRLRPPVGNTPLRKKRRHG